MKKILMLAALIFSLVSCTAFAAQEVKPNIGVLVIGSAEFKTPDYYKMIKNSVQDKTGFVADVGEDFQKKYQKFMLERYDIGKHRQSAILGITDICNNSLRNFLLKHQSQRFYICPPRDTMQPIYQQFGPHIIRQV